MRKNNFLSKVILLGLMAYFSSCISLTKAQTKGSYVLLEKSIKPIKAESVNIDSVQVYFKKDPPAGTVEIGIVEATAFGREVSLQDIFPELQKQAGMIGATGIAKIELQRFDHDGDAMSATAIAIRVPAKK